MEITMPQFKHCLKVHKIHFTSQQRLETPLHIPTKKLFLKRELKIN